MVQRQRKRNVKETEDEADKSLSEEMTAAAGGAESLGGGVALGGVGEVPRPPGERRTPEEGGLGKAMS